MLKNRDANAGNYWYGRFYCNPKDHHVFIKRRPGAWTMNWANWRSWALMAAELAAALAILSFFL